MRTLYNDIIDNIIGLRLLLASFILFLIFFLGSLGYNMVDGMSFFDGFYMTFITITTIGFSELKICLTQVKY